MDALTPPHLKFATFLLSDFFSSTGFAFIFNTSVFYYTCVIKDYDSETFTEKFHQNLGMLSTSDDVSASNINL
jgi:hypothetical protein